MNPLQAPKNVNLFVLRGFSFKGVFRGNLNKPFPLVYEKSLNLKCDDEIWV